MMERLDHALYCEMKLILANLPLLLLTIHKHPNYLSRKRCVCYNVVLNKRPSVPFVSCIMVRTLLSPNPFNSWISVKSVLILIL